MTVTQIDGIGAFDHIKRSSMIRGLINTPTAHQMLPYVMLAYGRQSIYWWRDDNNVLHEIAQGEGGEQGDVLMPMLFSLGLDQSLRIAQSRLQPNETLLAYLDDLYILTTPERAYDAYNIVTQTVYESCGISPNLGKTVCWNKAGIIPPRIEELGPEVWKGQGNLHERGLRILGSPFGTAEFIHDFGEQHIDKARQFVGKISELPELQHAWLMQYYCLMPRLNHLLRQVPPSQIVSTVQAFNDITTESLQNLLTGDALTILPPDAIRQARLPPRFAGLGLRDAVRTSTAAYFSSFADILPTLQSRHPQILTYIRNYLQSSPDTRSQTISNLDELES